MKTTYLFRSPLPLGGEILAQQVTFLPVEPLGWAENGAGYASPMRYFVRFLPVFDAERKNMTMAQPLLKEDLR